MWLYNRKLLYNCVSVWSKEAGWLFQVIDVIKLYISQKNIYTKVSSCAVLADMICGTRDFSTIKQICNKACSLAKIFDSADTFFPYDPVTEYHKPSKTGKYFFCNLHLVLFFLPETLSIYCNYSINVITYLPKLV